MQSVTDVILASDRGVQPAGPMPLTERERDSVAYFFSRLRLIEPMFFDQVAPDEDTERLVKREFSNMLRGFTREQIDLGLAGLKRAMADRHPDFKFLTLPKIIGLLECRGRLPVADGEWARAGIYHEARPERLLDDKGAKERRREVGRRECAKLLAMFDDEEAA